MRQALMPIALVCAAVVTVGPGVHTFSLEATGRGFHGTRLYAGVPFRAITGFHAEVAARWYVEEVL